MCCVTFTEHITKCNEEEEKIGKNKIKRIDDMASIFHRVVFMMYEIFMPNINVQIRVCARNVSRSIGKNEQKEYMR